MENPSDRIRIRVSLISIGVYLFLVVFKAVLGKLSGSASVVADAWHSLSDVLVSCLVLTGIRLAALEGKSRLFGWKGMEHVVSAIIGLFILGAAARIFAGASTSPPRVLANVYLTIAGTFVCVLVAYFAARLKIRVGMRENSPSLVADGYHSLMDMYSSIVVIIGLLGTLIGLELDKVAAAIISLFIATIGFEIIVTAVRALARGPEGRGFSLSDYVWRFAIRKASEGPIRGGENSVVDGLDWLRRQRRWAITLFCLVFGFLWVLSGLYRVQPGGEVLVARFGRIITEHVGPGLHYRLPPPIDAIHPVSLSQIHRLEVGFRTVPEDDNASDRSYLWESRHLGGRYEKRLEESLLLSGDENIIDMNYTIQYRVSDARKFLLTGKDPETLVRNVAEEITRSVVGAEVIDRVLTDDRQPIQERIWKGLDDKLREFDIGVSIVGVRLQDVHPPLEVVASFRDVASAKEDRSRLVNVAESYRNEVVPLARGDSARMVREAEARREERVKGAQGEASRFEQVAAQYRTHENVTALRLYLETMESVLPGLEKYIVEGGAGEQAVDLRFLPGPLKTEITPLTSTVLGDD